MSDTGALILIIEDEHELLEMLAEEMKSAGFGVVTAKNGNEGYEQTITHKPDLVISDIMMPEMGGYDYLWKIRYDHPELNTMPVMFLTALAETNDKIAALGIGIDDYITKPIDFELLIPQVWARINQVRRITGEDGR